VIIAALLYTPPPRQVSGSSQGGEGVTGDGDRHASEYEPANKFAASSAATVAHASPSLSDDLAHPEITDALSGPLAAI